MFQDRTPFADQAKPVLQRAFKSEPLEISIPKDVANVLFYDDEGKFSLSKAMENFAKVQSYEKKVEQLKRYIKKQGFRKRNNYTGNDKPRPDNSVGHKRSRSNANDFDGGII